MIRSSSSQKNFKDSFHEMIPDKICVGGLLTRLVVVPPSSIVDRLYPSSVLVTLV